ncbi:cyclin-dependent kinase [Anaeramoeba flamelloides]|nr:cyclin-dependent kinase [Anaeramoeba flamelloides]
MNNSSKKKSVFETYEFLGRIGKGSYGIVHKAREMGTNRYVAIKEYLKHANQKQDQGVMASTIREIKLLKELNFESVVKIEDVFYVEENGTRKMYIAFEYAEHDLYKIILHYHNRRQRMPEALVKSFMWQILNGMHYLHENWVIHRDIKPANILIKDTPDEKGVVKIADFGLARIFQDPFNGLGRDGNVVTIWYRAPELLLGSEHYTKAIDIWSIGCLFFELLRGMTLFRGEEIKSNRVVFQQDQMKKITQLLGVPDSTTWNGIEKYPFYQNMKDWVGKTNTLLKNISSNEKMAFSLLSKMLIYDPHKRITAKEALEHSYFRDSPLPTIPAFKNLTERFPEKEMGKYDELHPNPDPEKRKNPNPEKRRNQKIENQNFRKRKNIRNPRQSETKTIEIRTLTNTSKNPLQRKQSLRRSIKPKMKLQPNTQRRKRKNPIKNPIKPQKNKPSQSRTSFTRKKKRTNITKRK